MAMPCDSGGTLCTAGAAAAAAAAGRGVGCTASSRRTRFGERPCKRAPDALGGSPAGRLAAAGDVVADGSASTGDATIFCSERLLLYLVADSATKCSTLSLFRLDANAPFAVGASEAAGTAEDAAEDSSHHAPRAALMAFCIRLTLALPSPLLQSRSRSISRPSARFGWSSLRNSSATPIESITADTSISYWMLPFLRAIVSGSSSCASSEHSFASGATANTRSLDARSTHSAATPVTDTSGLKYLMK
mmetsp:Transcript_1136/g.3898  ORF Transcript_1136/g.3898 Transcript_1136/m.3898 type:complete len:248 (-) Transcript_1136:155-898(-)